MNTQDTIIDTNYQEFSINYIKFVINLWIFVLNNKLLTYCLCCLPFSSRSPIDEGFDACGIAHRPAGQHPLQNLADCS